MDKYMKQLYELALKSFNQGDIPVSCLILKDGEVVSEGFNDRYTTSKVTGHAEVNAITSLEEKIHDYRLNGYTMLCTLKPCEMCYSIIQSARIDKVYYLVDQKSSFTYPEDKYEKIYFPGNNYLIEYEKLFNDFFKNLR